jgi:spore germination protein YaaH
MAHKTVQFIIGQILTDEALRAQFLDEPIETLSALRDSGFDLTNAEIDALGRTDRRLWTSGARWIDARLQRCDLGSGGRDAAKPKTPR